MERKRFNGQRVTLLAIGAGASALALIAFSGTCWFATCWLDDTLIGELTFWDILCASTGGFAMILIVRPFRYARRDRAYHAVPRAPAATPSTLSSHGPAPCATPTDRAAQRSGALWPTGSAAPTDVAPLSHSTNAAAHRTSIPFRVADHVKGASTAPRWREMYEQLSEEERRIFKAVVKRYCTGE